MLFEKGQLTVSRLHLPMRIMLLSNNIREAWGGKKKSWKNFLAWLDMCFVNLSEALYRSIVLGKHRIYRFYM